MKFDNRGRLYYRTEFSPSQRSFSRNLLRFINPTLIKKNSKEEFIFFAKLGQSIKKHSCYEKAYTFVCENQENIIDTLKTFYWTTFLDPWVALNFILEFKRYFLKEERKEGVYLYIQLELDASSSMLQLLSTMILNYTIGKEVNMLLKNEEKETISKKLISTKKLNNQEFIKSIKNLERSDIYLTIANLYQTYIQNGGKAILLAELAKEIGQEVKHLYLSKPLIKFMFELDQ